jgi:hypothetical protein
MRFNPVPWRAIFCLGLALAIFQPPAKAQATSDSDRLEKLEQAVQQLQERNAQLEAEVKKLKKNASAKTASVAPPAEGPTKTKTTYDGKSYVETTVPIEDKGGSKWKLSTPLTELEIFGDIRLRYEYRAGQTDDTLTPPAHPTAGVAGRDDWEERNRERYRIRFGLRGTLADDWFFGIRLETSQNPRSTNVTFGDDTTGAASATNNGPFSKVSDGINVGQAYLGYKGFKDIVLMAGRMPQTSVLVTTRMVWDDDINPEGLSEQWKHSFSFGTSGDEAVEGYSKDGKSVATAPKSEPFLKLDLFANFNQFEYDDTSIENPLGPRATTTVNGVTQKIPNTDAFLLASQVGARLNFPKTIYAQIAPTLYNYTGNGDSFNAHFQGGNPFITNAASLAENQTGINSLLIYDMPWEIGWKIQQLPMRVFGDFAVNFEADDRALAAGHPGHGDQRYAYQAGVGVGQLKKKHDWQIDAYYQQTDQYALDPNLIDSDLFNQTLNLRGPVVRVGYMLSDAVWVNATWGYAWRVDKALGTGGVTDLAINPIDQYQIFQLDLNLKF